MQPSILANLPTHVGPVVSRAPARKAGVWLDPGLQRGKTLPFGMCFTIMPSLDTTPAHDFIPARPHPLSLSRVPPGCPCSFSVHSLFTFPCFGRSLFGVLATRPNHNGRRVSGQSLDVTVYCISTIHTIAKTNCCFTRADQPASATLFKQITANR